MVEKLNNTSSFIGWDFYIYTVFSIRIKRWNINCRIQVQNGFEIENQINKLIYADTPISFFKFLEIISIKNKNVLQAQAYNKNYFDSITKNIELTKGLTNNKKKINYTKDELKDIYLNKLKIDSNMWQSINDLCDRRNKNPLCHASCDAFSNKQDISISILNDINEINNLVDDIIKLYI